MDTNGKHRYQKLFPGNTQPVGGRTVTYKRKEKLQVTQRSTEDHRGFGRPVRLIGWFFAKARFCFQPQRVIKGATTSAGDNFFFFVIFVTFCG
jgi:hypothetical protein